MTNLIRMDLYRLQRSTAFKVCTVLAVVFALMNVPFEYVMTLLANMLVSEDKAESFNKVRELSTFLRSPFPFVNAMLAMISVTSFFYADIEFGYVKNIAGQMPKKGYAVLSKYTATCVHNLLFMLIGVVFNLLGALPFVTIATTQSVGSALAVFAVKFLLMQACCALLIWFVVGLRSKSLGTTFSVLMGTGLLMLLYLGIDAGINKLFSLKDFTVTDYMPDQLLNTSNPDAVTSIVVSVIFIALFVLLTVRMFDRRDVK